MTAGGPAGPAARGGGPVAAAPRRRRSAGSRVLLALLLLAGLLVSIEVVLRVGGFVQLDAGTATPAQAAFNAAGMFEASDDPELSYGSRPGAEASVGGTNYRHDARGFRIDAPEPGSGTPTAREAPEVAFLGDSTCYGLGLAAADALPAQTAAAMASTATIRALNCGVCGYGTAQEARLYEREFAGRPGVPVVVLVVFPNDFSRGTYFWDGGLHVMYVDPLPLPRGLKRDLWRSATYRALVSASTDRMKASGAFDPLVPGNADAPLAAVERLAAAVARDGRRLLVAHLPAMEALDPYAYAAPVERLARTCERLGVAYVDLLEGFLAERERQAAEYERKSGSTVGAELRRGFLSQYWIDDPADHHLNAAANRIAAAQLARAIEPLLPAPEPTPRPEPKPGN